MYVQMLDIYISKKLKISIISDIFENITIFSNPDFKVKGQGHSELKIKYGPVRTFGLFSSVSGMHGQTF